jgi:uncharacterized protein YuzE
MKLHYYPETDSLYIEMKALPSAETREVAPGLNVDLDANGEVIGFDVDFASKRFDLTDDKRRRLTCATVDLKTRCAMTA